MDGYGGNPAVGLVRLVGRALHPQLCSTTTCTQAPAAPVLFHLTALTRGCDDAFHVRPVDCTLHEDRLLLPRPPLYHQPYVQSSINIGQIVLKKERLLSCLTRAVGLFPTSRAYNPRD